MKKLKDEDLYVLLKNSGTFHLCRSYRNYDSSFITYKSLCGQHRKRMHESEKPIKVEDEDDIPDTRGHSKCKTCLKKFEKRWKDTMVNIPIPKIIAVKLKAAHENDTGLSKDEVEYMGELIDDHVSGMLLD